MKSGVEQITRLSATLPIQQVFYEKNLPYTIKMPAMSIKNEDVMKLQEDCNAVNLRQSGI